MNYNAVDMTLANLNEIPVGGEADSSVEIRKAVPDEAPEFVHDVLAKIIVNEGDSLPVSALPVDGTFPTGTTQWEKRNIVGD